MLISYKNKIRFELGVILSGIIFFSFNANADYAAKIDNPTDGYSLKISNNAVVSKNPVTAENGEWYYEVGSGIVLAGKNSPGVSITGRVNCFGTALWGDGNGKPWVTLPPMRAYHRLFMYAMPAGFNIRGNVAYKINENLVMTVSTTESIETGWKNIHGSVCSTDWNTTNVYVSDFSVHFPMFFNFYIKDRIIDNQVVIPSANLGGYVRYFADSVAPTINSWSLTNSTAPIRLESSVLSINVGCKASTSTGGIIDGTLNLRHGPLNSVDYDSIVSEVVNYSCTFSKSTPVKLRLDYEVDGNDPLNRLPMKNINNEKIYSEMQLWDDDTGRQLDIRGTEVEIHENKNIKIISHLKGNNAPTGNFRGSAWLIATYL